MDPCRSFNQYSSILDEVIPVPTQDHPINLEESRAWLKALCLEDQKRAGQALLQVTRYISFNELVQGLDRVIALGLFAKLGSVDRWVPLITMATKNENLLTKSGVYVLRIALQRYPELRANMCLAWNSPLEWYISHGITTFVVFDDAVYSGSQMSSTIQYIFEYLREIDVDHPMNINLYVVTPFISDEAIDKIIKQALISSGSEGSLDILLQVYHGKIKAPTSLDIQVGGFTVNLQILFDQKIYKASELIPDKKVAEEVVTLFGNRYPIYFQHKMPDYLSSYPSIYAGYIPPLLDPTGCPDRSRPQTIPFISGCEDAYRDAYASIKDTDFRVNTQFNARSQLNICPKPPYKS